MRLARYVALAAGPMLFAATAFAADPGAEITNAASHAALAAQAGNLNGVHTHMHHALNCLVGPTGDGFDTKEMNPCAQSGNGAIPDTTDQMKKTKLMAARDHLSKGLAEVNLSTAKAEASAAQAAIESAK